MTTSKADGSAASVDDGDWLGYDAQAVASLRLQKLI